MAGEGKNKSAKFGVHPFGPTPFGTKFRSSSRSIGAGHVRFARSVDAAMRNSSLDEGDVSRARKESRWVSLQFWDVSWRVKFKFIETTFIKKSNFLKKTVSSKTVSCKKQRRPKAGDAFRNTAHVRFSGSTGLHVEHRPPREGLLKVDKLGFRVQGSGGGKFG